MTAVSSVEDHGASQPSDFAGECSMIRACWDGQSMWLGVANCGWRGLLVEVWLAIAFVSEG